MNLREQEYICAIARNRSITKAAKELSITQAALSLFVQNLEKRLDVQLFERYKKEMVPTQIGEMYITSAQKILAEGEHFRKSLQNYIDRGEGRIRVGITRQYASAIVPELLTDMKERYPNVVLQVKTSESAQLVRALQSDELDCIYAGEGVDDAVHRSEALCTDRIGFVFGKCHPVAGKRGRAFSGADINGSTILVLENDDTKSLLKTMLRECEADVQIQTYDSVEILMSLVEQNYGIAFMSEGCVQQYSRMHQKDNLFFRVPEEAYDNSVINLYFSCHERLSGCGYATDFREILRQITGEYMKNK